MKRINIFLDDREEKILNELIAKYGGKPPAIMKEALKLRHDKAFNPAYIKGGKPLILDVDAPPEPKIYTQPEACEFFGGKVDMFHLKGRTCVGPVDRKGNQLKTAPLSAMGIVSQYGDFTMDDTKVVEAEIPNKTL